MKTKHKFLAAALMVALLIVSGCVWYEEDTSNDSPDCCWGPVDEWWPVVTCYDYDSFTDTCYDSGLLDVGFGCGYCCGPTASADGSSVRETTIPDIISRSDVAPDDIMVVASQRPDDMSKPAGPDGAAPAVGCGYDNESLSLDTVYLDYLDHDLIDLQFNYFLDNYSNDYIWVYVDLCDYYTGPQECFNLTEFIMYPGESWWDRAPSEVLDTLLYSYYDCLSANGPACSLSYNIDVYLGEDCMCVPVVLDYIYDGLYSY